MHENTAVFLYKGKSKSRYSKGITPDNNALKYLKKYAKI